MPYATALLLLCLMSLSLQEVLHDHPGSDDCGLVSEPSAPQDEPSAAEQRQVSIVSIMRHAGLNALLIAPGVYEELKLTDEQIGTLAGLREQFREQARDAGAAVAEPDELRRLVRELADLEGRMFAVFNDAQRDRLLGLMIQRQRSAKPSHAGLLYARVAENLQLTAEQTAAVEDTWISTRYGRPRKSDGKVIAHAESLEASLQVLTKSQRELYDRMPGAAFVFPAVVRASASTGPNSMTNPAPDNENAKFWKQPEVGIPEGPLKPVAVTLVVEPAVPDKLMRASSRLEFTSEIYRPSNPAVKPNVIAGSASCRISETGLAKGSQMFADRRYTIESFDPQFEGLSHLVTRMDDKAILDGRFSIIVNVDQPAIVFLAIDQRALDTWDVTGAPAWLHEYQPTGRLIRTDEPVMKSSGAAYAVFRRSVPAGRVAFGPPAMNPGKDAMYYAIFAADPAARPAAD